MKKLLLLMAMMPFFAQAQWVNGTFQKEASTKYGRYFQGSNIDTLVFMNGAPVNGYVPVYNSTSKKTIWTNPSTFSPTVPNGILSGRSGTLTGNSIMTFLNDSTITYRSMPFIHLDLTNQNPSGGDWSLFMGPNAGKVFKLGLQGYANTGAGLNALMSLRSDVASEASSNTVVGHNGFRFATNITGVTGMGTGVGDALTDNTKAEAATGISWHTYNQALNAYHSTSGGAASSYQLNTNLPVAIWGYRGCFSCGVTPHVSGIGANVFEFKVSGGQSSANGAFAGRNNQGSYGVFDGYDADAGGSYDIMIGPSTRPSTWNASNELNIGNVILGKGISTDSAQNTSAQIGIGVNRASSIAASAILDLTSTNKGFLTPRMTGAQRAAISPHTGLLLYETNVNKFKYYNGSSWRTIADSATVAGGNAATATALQTARTIGTLTGDVTVTGSSFDGTANNTNTATVTKINGTSLAGLSTGILKNTTSTGVPSIAVAGTDYLSPSGSGASLSNVVNSIAGTSNQITASSSTGAVTLSLPSSVILPGRLGVNGAANVLDGVALPNQGYIYFYNSGTSGSANAYIRNNGQALELYSGGSKTIDMSSAQGTTLSGTLGINGVADNVKSGTYTPTGTNVANMSAITMGSATYSRVGAVVHVSGSFVATVTNGVDNKLGISLPVSSNFGAITDAHGGLNGMGSNSSNYYRWINADVTNDRAQLTMGATAGGSDTFYYEFDYVII